MNRRIRPVSSSIDAIASLTPSLSGFQDLLDNFPGAFLVLDANWRIVYANARATRLYRNTRKELYGSLPWEQWPSALQSNIEQKHRRALTEQLPVQLQYGPGEGREEWFEVRAYSSDVGIIVYYHDISEQ